MNRNLRLALDFMLLFSAIASVLGTPIGIALIIFGSIFANSTILIAIGATILIFAILNTIIFWIMVCHSFNNEAKARIEAVK